MRSVALKRVLGVWDLSAAPLSLGGLLIFVEEMLIAAGEKSCDLALIGDESSAQNHPVLRVISELSGIDKIFWIAAEDVKDLGQEYELWPSEKEYRYGTTLYAQQSFQKQGAIPDLSFKPATRQRATDFYKKHVHPKSSVVVHLKNNPRQPGESNADLGAWATFFSHCIGQNIKFVLIGNEDPGEKIRSLDNVVVTSDHGEDLVRDLALIENAFLFMGMASGPCNAAIFSKTPYVIFKNPDHHRREMQEELGDKDHFIFSGPFQKMLRVKETSDILIKNWEYVAHRLQK